MGMLKEIFDKSKAISTGDRRVDFALAGSEKAESEKSPESPPASKPKSGFRLTFPKTASPTPST